jgi:hypothetical protein
MALIWSIFYEMFLPFVGPLVRRIDQKDRWPIVSYVLVIMMKVYFLTKNKLVLLPLVQSGPLKASWYIESPFRGAGLNPSVNPQPARAAKT